MLSTRWIACAACCAGLLSAPAGARNFDLLGSASLDPDGRVRLISDVHSPGQGNGAMALVVPPALRLRSLDYLGAQVDLTDDGAGAGSPRFVIALDTNGSRHYEASDALVSAFIGTPPAFDDPPSGSFDTGNLVRSADRRWDTRALTGGRIDDTFAHLLQLARNLVVLRVAIVVDGGYVHPDNEQTVLLSWVRLNRYVYAGGPDADEDGIPDGEDRYPGSDLRPRIDVNGALAGETRVENFVDELGWSLQDRVNECARVSRSSRDYRRRLNRLLSRLLRLKQLTPAQAAEMRGAARLSASS